MSRRAITAMLILAGACSPAAGQERSDSPRNAGFRRNRAKWREAAYRGEESRADRLIDGLGLSEKKADQVREALRDYRHKARERRAELDEQLRDLRADLNEAVERRDGEATEARLRQMRQLWRRQKQQNTDGVIDALAGILSKDQLEQAKLILQPREAHSIGRILRALRSIPLSETQQAKIEAILDGAANKIEGVLKPHQREQLRKSMESTGARWQRRMRRLRARPARRHIESPIEEPQEGQEQD